MKDITTGKPIIRCNSSGDLYPVTSSLLSSPPFTFAAISGNLWHSRLGHPGPSIFQFLRKNDLFPIKTIFIIRFVSHVFLESK